MLYCISTFFPSLNCDLEMGLISKLSVSLVSIQHSEQHVVGLSQRLLEEGMNE